MELSFPAAKILCTDDTPSETLLYKPIEHLWKAVLIPILIIIIIIIFFYQIQCV